MTPRSAIAALVVAGCCVTSCSSSDLPTKEAFIEQAQKSLGDQLAGYGISAKKSSTITSDFAGCVYDKIKGDEALLKDAFGESTNDKVEKAIQDKAGDCMTSMQTAVQSAVASK